MKIAKHLSCLFVLLAATSSAFADGKPKLTLDEFFNSVSYNGLAISPDGNSVVIGTERADWDQKIFRTDLWLYRDDAKAASPTGPTLIQLTQSGHDSDPKWSPDGRWIAFLSDRKTSSDKDSDSSDDKNSDSDKEVSQLYVISPAGGEAIPLTQGDEEVHTFSWSADSRTIYFATRNPWTKTQKDDYKKQWKDVVQYRTAERGDTIFALDVAAALARNAAKGTKEESDTEKESDLNPGASAIASSPLRVEDLITSPDGSNLAFVTNSINQRAEKPEDVEIFVIDVARAPSPASAGSENKPATSQPRQLTHNQALEGSLRWANDNRHIFFTSENDPSGPYRDLQPHLYWVDSEKPNSEKPETIEQWSKDFIGPVEHYDVAADTVLTSARIGTEVSMYSVAHLGQSLHQLNGWEGTYETLSASTHSPRIAFVYSSLQPPAEIYLADSPDKL